MLKHNYNVVLLKIDRTPCLFGFCRYHLPAKCVVVSGTRRPAPVAGARNRCLQLAPENWPVCHHYQSTVNVGDQP